MISDNEIDKLKNKEEEYFEPAFSEDEQKGGAAITHPFDPTKIDIRPQPLTILSLIRRLETSRINLNTEFQRKKDLWSIEAKSRLIESLLVRIPLPAFYFDATSDNWLIVDGLQRISTLKDFIIDHSFKLTGLEYLKEFNGFEWDSLPEHLRGRIEETAITAYIINPGTPKGVKFNIFKRINTGGIVLSPQEIRHALNQGNASKLVAEMAEYDEFKTAMGGKIPTDRMEDRDYVTRFIAFYLIGWENYEPDLDSFMNRGLAAVNAIEREEVLNEIRSAFRKSMVTAYEIFAEYAFRKKYTPKERRKPINKALFESISVSLARKTGTELVCLIEKKEIVDKELMNLFNDNEFYLSISSATGDTLSVTRRHQKIDNLFNTILNDQKPTA